MNGTSRMFAFVVLTWTILPAALNPIYGWAECASHWASLPQSGRNSNRPGVMPGSAALFVVHRGSNASTPHPSGEEVPGTDSTHRKCHWPDRTGICRQTKWQIDVWHGWMDAPYLRSQWTSLWQTGAIGETFLVGGYPAAWGIRLGRNGLHWSYGLQMGCRKHFTQQYLVATLLDEQHHTNASVLAWTETKYMNRLRWSIGGQIGVGMAQQKTQFRVGSAQGTQQQAYRWGSQITPLILRLKRHHWGGFIGIGYGTAGILQSGFSLSLGH